MAAKDTTKTFLYSGLDRNSEKATGQITANNLQQAKDMVRKLGVAADRISPKSSLSWASLNTKPITAENITNFSRQLSTMLKAGLPLIQSLTVAAESTEEAHIKQFIVALRNNIASGATFSDTLRNYPNQFDDLYCNLIAAGEISGTLDTMLERISVFQEKDARLKANIKKALTYPISVMVVAAIVSAVLLIKVVPAFETTFASFGSELPAFTQFVVGISEFTQEWWLHIIGALFLLIASFKIAVKQSASFSYAVDKYLLKAPVVGKIAYLSAIARFSRTLATTFAAGIPMLDALTASSGAAGNQHITAAISQVRLTVSQGTLLNRAMKDNGIFPPLLEQLTKVGEEAGALDDMLNKAAETYEDSVDDAVDTMTALMEPMIMSFLAVVIGGLMIAMYLPIFLLGSAM